MLKRLASLLVIVLAVLLVPAALPQMEPTPTVYVCKPVQVPGRIGRRTRRIPRRWPFPSWKMTANGTIIRWSTFETVVHTADGYTHGTAWESTSIAGLMKVLDEVRKAGPRPGQDA